MVHERFSDLTQFFLLCLLKSEDLGLKLPQIARTQLMSGEAATHQAHILITASFMSSSFDEITIPKLISCSREGAERF